MQRKQINIKKENITKRNQTEEKSCIYVQNTSKELSKVRFENQTIER